MYILKILHIKVKKEWGGAFAPPLSMLDRPMFLTNIQSIDMIELIIWYYTFWNKIQCVVYHTRKCSSNFKKFTGIIPKSMNFGQILVFPTNFKIEIEIYFYVIIYSTIKIRLSASTSVISTAGWPIPTRWVADGMPLRWLRRRGLPSVEGLSQCGRSRPNVVSPQRTVMPTRPLGAVSFWLLGILIFFLNIKKYKNIKFSHFPKYYCFLNFFKYPIHS